MTTPAERTRALLWAGGFLIEVARDNSLPVTIRQRAAVIARHFPTIEDVASLDLGLAPTSDVISWAQDCRSGPLRYSTELEWPAG